MSFLEVRNCTDTEVFTVQAGVLKQKFIDKGYDNAILDYEIQRAINTERKTLLEIKPKKDPDEKLKWAMLTSFSIQHKQVQNIVKKHWEVLRQDNVLGKLLPGDAKVIFRGAPSLQGRIAPNVINPPSRPSFFHNMTGFYPCRKCDVCQHNTLDKRKITEFTSTTTGKKYTVKPFCTCSTRYIVTSLLAHATNNT